MSKKIRLCGKEIFSDMGFVSSSQLPVIVNRTVCFVVSLLSVSIILNSTSIDGFTAKTTSCLRVISPVFASIINLSEPTLSGIDFIKLNVYVF